MLRKADIFDAIQTGFYKASEDYRSWSGNRTIHDAGIEFLATARIAESLIEKARLDSDKSWIYLEMPFKQIRESAGVARHRPGRKPAILSGNPRVDLAYFDRSENVRGIIELKRHLSYSNIYNDLARICALLDYYGKPYGMLKFGVVAAVRPIASSQSKSLTEVSEGIVAKFREEFGQKISYNNVETNLSGSDDIPYEDSEDSEDSDPKKVNGIGISCFYITNKSGE